MKLLLAITILTAIARVALIFVHIPELAENSYKAMAHIYVGGLFGAHFATRKTMWNRPAYWYMAWVLTAVEILAFLVDRIFLH